MSATDRPRRRPLAVLAAVATVAALAAAEAARPVLLPLVLALFLAGVLGPLELRLARRLPRGAAAMLCLLLALLALTAFAGVLGLALWELRRAAGGLEAVLGRLDGIAAARDLPRPSQWLPAWSYVAMARAVWGALGQTVLTLAFLTLGLLELAPAQAKLRRLRVGERAARVLERIAVACGRFLLARSALGLVSGLLITGVTALAGVELALVSGVLAFLLAYIPSIGTLVAVIPPSLFALIQLGVGWRSLAVVAGCAAVQILMFNFVNHLVLGKVLVVPPLGILTSVLFWGWLWGPVGAFLGVPLSMALLLVAEEARGAGARGAGGRSVVELWARLSPGSRGS